MFTCHEPLKPLPLVGTTRAVPPPPSPPPPPHMTMIMTFSKNVPRCEHVIGGGREGGKGKISWFAFRRLETVP